MNRYRVYIAAPFQLKAEAQSLRALFSQHFICCTSTWLHGDAADLETRSDASARVDLNDVCRADALVALNPADWAASGTGGRHVEFGYALALRKPILVFGAKTNIFHEHSDVSVVATEDQLISWLLDRMDADS